MAKYTMWAVCPFASDPKDRELYSDWDYFVRIGKARRAARLHSAEAVADDTWGKRAAIYKVTFDFSRYYLMCIMNDYEGQVEPSSHELKETIQIESEEEALKILKKAGWRK